MLYTTFGRLPVVEALLYGIKAAVLNILIEALLHVARRALKSKSEWGVAAPAFLAPYCFDVPFPVVMPTASDYDFWVGAEIHEEHTGSLPSLQTPWKTVLLWSAV